MSKLEVLLEDGLRSELMFKQKLKTLSEALRQQLQETERRQTKELERRIYQDALLSTDPVSSSKKEDHHLAKHVRMRRSISTTVLTSDKVTSHCLKQSARPNSSSPGSPITWKQCSGRTPSLTPTRTQVREQVALFKTTQMRKEEEAEAECQRKFCALQVPNHVIQPLFQEMMELKEKERKQSHEQRKNFLLSIQKPFSFQEREKEKREKLVAILKEVSQNQKNKVPTARKPLYKVEKDSLDSELKDQEEGCRTVHTQTTVRQENSIASCCPAKVRTAERTRKEKLGFLDKKPSFQPKIIQQVPDFSRSHKALQTEVLRKTQSKEVTKCQPFYFRTAALPSRQSSMSLENSQEPKISRLSRSKSHGVLTSLSADTLPVYITDAARKRCVAIRKSMEMRDSKNRESADWLRKYQMRSQAMSKTVALHAKLLDPHSSLKEVNDEKLKHYIVADRQRTREYMKELRDMKARVSERPYLFEQVKQKNAKAHAEQTYRDKLRKAGLKEQFVQENGETTEVTSVLTRSEDDTGVNEHNNENNIHSREVNVDDGEKIEDVEEESVKSKREEMP